MTYSTTKTEGFSYQTIPQREQKDRPQIAEGMCDHNQKGFISKNFLLKGKNANDTSNHFTIEKLCGKIFDFINDQRNSNFKSQ